MMINNKNLSKITGYTLLELSVVLLIIALIAGSGVIVGKTSMDSAQSATTNNRLNVIETALMAFRIAGNRLPCPADGTLTESSANFGTEAASVGNCKDNVVGHIQANFSATVSGSTIVEGVVPVRSLNLPDSFMYDGWGRKITYAVWAPMTATRAFLNYGITFNCGLVSMGDAAGGVRSNRALYVLLSYGQNGHGAYTVQGTKYSSGSVNLNELTNCHCSSAAADTGYAGNYVMKDYTLDSTNPLDTFDDVLRYRERWEMQNYSDQNSPTGGNTCPQSSAGFRTDGASAGDASGTSVAVGDINGDGIPDLIIGAPGRNGNTGSVYVLFGTRLGFLDPIPLSGLGGSNGFRIDGISGGDLTGASVAAADVNGDGIADVIIGAPGANGGKGSVFILYGTRTAWPAAFALSGINGTNGIRLDGVLAGGKAGYAVAAGDVNNDGFADVVIGAPGANTNSGIVYVVFGSNAYARSQFTLDNNASTGIINNAATTGITITPITASDQLGYSVAAGDTNGDGITDIVMGHNGFTGNIGLASIVTGKGRGSWYTPIPAIDLTGFNGWHMFGNNSGDKFGSSVAVGDVNGDQIGDIIVGAPGATAGGHAGAGITYVILGNNATKWREMYVNNINSFNGWMINGINAGDASGTSVAVGDVNGDTVGDIIIGAPNASPGAVSHAGSTYVVFGNNTSPGTSFNLSGLNGINGFELDGATANENSGAAVAAGDINGDGRMDIIIGAPGSGRNGTAGSGSTYVYFGQKLVGTWPNPYSLSGL